LAECDHFPIVPIQVKSTLGASNITRNYVIYNKTFHEFTDETTTEYQDTLINQTCDSNFDTFDEMLNDDRSTVTDIFKTFEYRILECSGNAERVKLKSKNAKGNRTGSIKRVKP